MNIYELVTNKEYRKKTKGVAKAIMNRHKSFEQIKKFAIEQRGWPERQAEMLAGQMTGSIRTQFP